jgi:nucleoside-triphosphatase
MRHVLLLTGRPGVGKTTVIRKIAAGLAGRRLGGFYTEEMRVNGERRGFRLVTFDGRDGVMAHVDVRGAARVGKYGVDVAVVDELAGAALVVRPDVCVYLVDEIGKMECCSPAFVKAMRELLDSTMTVIATVARSGGGFIAEVKARADAELLEVTRSNRDELPGRVLAWLTGRAR